LIVTLKWILIIFSRTVTEKVGVIFPPHLISACALTGETRNQEIDSFRLKAAYCFANKQT